MYEKSYSSFTDREITFKLYLKVGRFLIVIPLNHMHRFETTSLPSAAPNQLYLALTNSPPIHQHGLNQSVESSDQ